MRAEGVVIKSTGSWYSVRLNDGNVVEARIKGKFRLKGIKTTNPIAVGDKVEVELNAQANLIVEIHERTNYIIRKSINLSKRAHIIASNVDQTFLIVTLAQPKTFSAFIDRFLVSAEAYHIPVIILFNKIDIYNNEELRELEYLKRTYEQIGYRCVCISAQQGTNIDEIKGLMQNKTSVIAGHSGVGKSTLINKIDNNLRLKTNQVSDYHKSGMHTTTNAEMFSLQFGGYIVDTPGIKAFGLIDFNKNELSHYFIEMRAVLHDCKFNNCQHINEPNCAVKKAVAEGNIAKFRYLNYLSMHEDDEEETFRTNNY